MFDRLPTAKTDSLMMLGRLMQADPRGDKIDLGVGTYRDETGAIPIMTAVKTAEALLHAEQTSKGYVGPAGDAAFALGLQAATFPGLSASLQARMSRIQTWAAPAPCAWRCRSSPRPISRPRYGSARRPGPPTCRSSPPAA